MAFAHFCRQKYLNFYVQFRIKISVEKNKLIPRQIFASQDPPFNLDDGREPLLAFEASILQAKAASV